MSKVLKPPGELSMCSEHTGQDTGFRVQQGFRVYSPGLRVQGFGVQGAKGFVKGVESTRRAQQVLRVHSAGFKGTGLQGYTV